MFDVSYSRYNGYMMFQRFLCGGRLIFGPDVASLFFSVILVAGPAIAFCIKVHNIINHNKKNVEDYNSWYGVLVVAIALTCLVSKSNTTDFTLLFIF